MRVRRNHNGMKRNEEIGLLTLPSIFIDKSSALWSFKSAFRQSNLNSHVPWMTLNINKSISTESFQGKNWVRTELSKSMRGLSFEL